MKNKSIWIKLNLCMLEKKLLALSEEMDMDYQKIVRLVNGFTKKGPYFDKRVMSVFKKWNKEKKLSLRKPDSSSN